MNTGRHENTFCEPTCVCVSDTLVRGNRKTTNVEKPILREEERDPGGEKLGN